MARRNSPSTIMVAGILSWLAIQNAGCESAMDSAGETRQLAGKVDELKTEVERLKDKAPDQAHAMVSVDYHFSNLWFAAQAENWPLADFFWKETLSHMRWAVRVIPIRKDNAGKRSHTPGHPAIDPAV